MASAGRFHLFDVAHQLHRLECLRRFYTGYPVWKVRGIPERMVSSFPWIIGPLLLANQRGLEPMSAVGAQLNWVAVGTFDAWVKSRLEPCEVFHFLSGCGARTLRHAKERYGAVTVCDKGSTHVFHQDAIVAEEYARWGFRHRPPFARRVVERELQEYEESDVILVPSSFVYRSFVEQGIPERRLRKIPYGVDLAQFRPAPREDNVFRVIYVGALNLRKGIPYLLEALAPLRLPRFETWLVGLPFADGRPFLRRYEGTYRHFGYLPRESLYWYYSQASVFVIASIEEGLATVIAQAMACGLPVIATTNTGAEDLLEDGVEGYIVPIRDPAAIREKVLQLYRNPDLREEMGNAALRKVRQLRGWDSYGEALMSMYRETIARTQRG
ncbi:MAG: glycosyltransferase family 4 protein [Armatimonadota bacterium]|nr:glycosyltransferase family 4 protein [Armatimonadota bacterium]MDR7494696.1 glycosyltransferase family 4 protein [Armatimonadota bacterium]MDR7500242.1 glycosyltransferase family 4 protein [Armatimonadota bacterium]MDR7573544.1 glycosyltransferase family 4 protein [Armatimonadota bacterium]